mgnify:FL=1
MNDEFEALAPVEAPTNWIGGLLVFAGLIFVYAIVG